MHSVLTEGKTKVIKPITIARILSKSDITAGDGAKHDLLEGKAEFSTTTTSNVFQLLKYSGLPVAFYEQDSPTSFLAPLCRMLPFEVVVRAEAHGSYLKRHPSTEKGFAFSKPLVEFYLKTKDRKWEDFSLPCDDPLLSIDAAGGMMDLWKPNEPQTKGCHFLRLKQSEVVDMPDDWQLFDQMQILAEQAFFILHLAWELSGYNLVDFKIEFGIDVSGTLLIADVIDNDSWRLLYNGVYVDKQVYREGGDLVTVQKNYERIATLSAQLLIRRERIKKRFEKIYK